VDCVGPAAPLWTYYRSTDVTLPVRSLQIPPLLIRLHADCRVVLVLLATDSDATLERLQPNSHENAENCVADLIRFETYRVTHKNEVTLF